MLVDGSMSYGWRFMLAEDQYRSSEQPMARRRTEVRYRTFVRWMMLEASLDEAYASYFLIKSPQGDEGRGGHHGCQEKWRVGGILSVAAGCSISMSHLVGGSQPTEMKRSCASAAVGLPFNSGKKAPAGSIRALSDASAPWVSPQPHRILTISSNMGRK